MNNMQLYRSIGIPTLTVVLAWLSNRSDINRLSDKLDSTAANLNESIGRLTELHHKDNLALMGYMIPLHERMAKLELHDESKLHRLRSTPPNTLPLRLPQCDKL